MVLRFSHFPAFSPRGSHVDHIFVPEWVQEPPDWGSWGHLGNFLAIFCASSGRHLGTPALYEPCLVASWSQTVLPKPSKTIPKTFFGLKILKFLQFGFKYHEVSTWFQSFHAFQFSNPASLQSSNHPSWDGGMRGAFEFLRMRAREK